MKTSPLDPNIADVAPAGPALTVYDEEHLITYMRVPYSDGEMLSFVAFDLEKRVKALRDGLECA